MKSTLIKDTTKSERIQLIKEWEETGRLREQRNRFNDIF